jgi:hypothetical protein
MGDKVLPPSDSRGTGQGLRGKVPLSVSTARVDSKAGWTPRGSQSSPVVRSAQPPSPPRRSTSDPHTATYSSSSSFSSPSDDAPPYASPVRAATTPKSAGFKNSMGFGGKGPKSPTIGDPRRKSGSDVSVTAHRRKSSHEWKTNVHTECGRHGYVQCPCSFDTHFFWETSS